MPLLDQIFAAERARRIETDAFTYRLVWATTDLVASAVRAAQSFTVAGDADFAILSQQAKAYSAAGVLVVDPDFTVAIQDSGSGRYLENGLVHIGNYFGSGEQPFRLPIPKLIRAGSVLTVEVTNNTSTAAALYMAFTGMKIFYKPGFDRLSLFGVPM